jgi:hypothetical protein
MEQKKKVCKRCKKEKSHDHFFVRHEMADGRSSECKQCNTDRMKEKKAERDAYNQMFCYQ